MKKRNILRKCWCGCGRLRKKYDTNYKERIYIVGHYGREKRIKKKCEVCGKKFIVIPYRKNRAKCCSEKCRLKWLHNYCKKNNKCFFNSEVQKELNKKADGRGGKVSQKIIRKLKVSAFYDPKIQAENIKKGVETNRKNRTGIFFDKKLQSKRSKKCWKNPEYRKKIIPAILRGLMKRPTSFEQRICDLCLKYSLPFVYTGDGRFLINFKNPDFTNYQERVVIEVFYSWFKIRDYGSVENYKEFCKEKYNPKGWKVIFLDEKDVWIPKNWGEVCLNKIKDEKIPS